MGDEEKIKVELPLEEFSEINETWWRHAVIEGGRYSLKSHTIARIILLRMMERPYRVACLRQFQKNIEDSSHQLLTDLIDKYGFTGFTVTNNEIRHENGSNIIFKGLDRNVESTIKSLEGVDLTWVDEAQTITIKSIRVLVPTIRKQGSQLIWTLNRLTDLDPVISYFITDPPRDDVWHLQVDYKMAESYGWLSDEMRKEIEYSRIHHPEDYAHDYLGKAMNQSDKSILSVSKVLEAMNREVEDDGAVEVGADIARMGNDRTEFVKRKGLKEIARKTYSKLRTTEVCDELEIFVDFDKEVLIKIDDTGVGGGVTDEMIKRSYNVMAINFGSKASDSDKYPNLISEAWFYMQKIIDTISIISDKDLLSELSNRQWAMDSKGKRGVESKDNYKKRGYRSPDKADATILCFYTPEVHEIQWATADQLL